MTILLILGGVLLGSIVAFVFFSNVYLELASRRARERRWRARFSKKYEGKSSNYAPRYQVDGARNHRKAIYRT